MSIAALTPPFFRTGPRGRSRKRGFDPPRQRNSVCPHDGTTWNLHRVHGGRPTADHGRLHPVPTAARETADRVTPITDLHTHYAGCVRGEDLVAIEDRSRSTHRSGA